MTTTKMEAGFPRGTEWKRMNAWTGRAESLGEWLNYIKADEELMSNVTHWRTIPPRPSVNVPLPGICTPLGKKD
jgi:DEAD/DEAH box helicase domain-containing protein